MQAAMPGYSNLPDIDIDTDDLFAPEHYRQYIQAAQEQQPVYEAPVLVRPQFSNGPAPMYQEQGYTHHPHNEVAYDYQPETSMVEEDLGRYQRYSTPELEGGNNEHDRSFDGPEEYQSTEDHHHHTRQHRYVAEDEDMQRTPRRRDRDNNNKDGAARSRQRRFVSDGANNSALYVSDRTEVASGLDEFDEKMGLGDDKEEEHLNPHFGPAPALQLRRNRTKKRVALSNGNLVIDAPIPSRLGGFLPRKGTEEFDRMRYSAVTCDPDDFEKNQYTLRPAMYNRETELLIGITMYNEDEILLTRTLHGVMKNISHLCSRQKSKVWGKDGWKKIVVVIVADGRKVVHPRVLDCLAALGVYQKDVGKNKVDSKVVQAHVYEYTTQLSIDPELKFKGLEKGIVPTQIVFCLKEKNAKKINSHRWLFNAFCPMLQPNVVVLLDVGTKPGPKSLYHLWKTFDMNSNVGGACGEICTMKGRFWSGLLNPMVASQNFEYKMSNILDKPTESRAEVLSAVFGYISVLPGAFSAYRYIALKNDDMGRGPLASYFKGETLAGHDADVFTSNMYLAEDRILCWELVAKRGDSWVLKFVKNAQGETDVPDSITEFISQRRRWLNGSFFAAVYAISHCLQLNRTEHSMGRKAALYLETFYNIVNLVFAWFGLGNYLIFFFILTNSLEDKSYGIPHIGILNMFMQYTYLGTLAATFLLAMGNTPRGAKWQYMSVMIIFSVLTTYMITVTVFCLIQSFRTQQTGGVYAQLIISIISTYGVYIISSFLALDPWHMFTCLLQYMLCSPIWINVLNIYAFSNLHDFSWGTKEDGASEDLGSVTKAKDGTMEVELPTDQADIDAGYDDALHSLRTRPKLLPRAKTQAEKDRVMHDYYASTRTNVVLIWALSNGILAAAILSGADPTESFSNGKTKQSVYMLIILILVAVLAVFRLACSTAYLLVRMFAG